MIAEDETVQHEEEDARVAEEREEDEGEEDKAEHDYSRSRIFPIHSSGTLIVPSVSVFFTVP